MHFIAFSSVQINCLRKTLLSDVIVTVMTMTSTIICNENASTMDGNLIMLQELLKDGSNLYAFMMNCFFLASI